MVMGLQEFILGGVDRGLGFGGLGFRGLGFRGVRFRV